MDDFKSADFAIMLCIIVEKIHTKIRLFAYNYNLFAVIYNEFKVSLTVVDFQLFKRLFEAQKLKQN